MLEIGVIKRKVRAIVSTIRQRGDEGQQTQHLRKRAH